MAEHITPTADTPRLVHGVCPHDCPDGCGTFTEVAEGKAVRFFADPDHPITRGWLCAKVRPYLDRVNHPERLTHPMRRVGAKGGREWARISWHEAIAEIAGRWTAIIAEHGAAAILPYSYSGTLGLVEIGVAGARLWNRMGACGLERSICDAATTAAVNATYGDRLSPDPRDVRHSKAILIWGHNPASTGPHFMPMLRDAQRDGAYVVVIDPRRTLTARSADLHIAPNPATDAALAFGLMHVLFRDNLHDEAWLTANTLGWEELRDRAATYDPERVAAITGVSATVVEDLAHRLAASKPVLLKIADGINRHRNGGQTVRSIISLPAVLGHVGLPGGGLFYSQSGHIHWDAAAVGHASECPPTPRTVNMNRLGAVLTGEAADPPIQSLYVFAANPVTSSPNAALTIRGLLRDDLFTVVHEQFMTDTASYADIVLPATTQLEQVDLHKPYGHRHIQYNHAATAPMGECRSNWTVMRDIAAAMGYTDQWLRDDSETVIAEILAATAKTNPRLAGITMERLKTEGAIPYAFAAGEEIPFADGRFPTPSGRLELRSAAMAAAGLDPLPDYVPSVDTDAGVGGEGRGLTLLSGAAHHFVSSSFANQPKLLAKEGMPFIEINPSDAADRGIADGADVTVSNARGSCRLRAVVTEDVRPGVAVAQKGWWGALSPDGRNVNWLTSDALADLGGQATFHTNRVEIAPTAVDARSRDLVASAD
ncbi:MAG: molybdopterin-containing oxidoreductase family protein [Thermomicrobiales bacterium]